MTRKPHANTRMANFVERRVLELKPTKNQAEISAQAGYANPNMLTMIKQGRSKVALDRVPSLAHALEADPAFLMRLALEQAIGHTAAKAIVEVFGEPVTKNETGWLQAIREASNNTDPRLTSRSEAALKAIFGR